MSRIDQHIDAVRTRFLIQKLLGYLAWTVLIGAGVLILTTLTGRLFAIELPPRVLMVGGAVLLALFIGLVLAITYAPSREATAVKIDEVLGLKERFSTALASRDSREAFARAAVRDAEATAEKVSIRKRFPYSAPKLGYYSLGAVAAFVMVDAFMPQLDLAGSKQSQRQAQVVAQKKVAAEKALKEALAEVMSIPKVGAEEKNLQAAKREIESMLSQEIRDPAEATRTAQNALKEAENARKRVEDLQKYADAQTQKESFKNLGSESSSAVMAEVKKSLADGKFEEAAAKLKQAVATFNQADPAQQAKMANDMRNMAEQLQKMAQDPAVQERVKKELEKQGATREQARQMAQEMARAAAGDKEAQQRVQNMTENLARRMNGGALPAPSQLAPLMQKVQQMQGQMNSQARAEDLSQAVQQLATAMKQQASQSKAGQQGQNGQQASGQKSGQKSGNNQQGNGQQQANNQQQAQQGSKPGQQGQAKGQSQQGEQGSDQQQGQQSADGSQNDAQQALDAAAAQLEAMQQANEAAQASAGGDQQGNGNGEGEGQGWGDGQGQQGGNQGGKGNGGNGFSGPNAGGMGSGERPKGVPAPYTVKNEVSPGESDSKGKVIATWLVKADSVKGESKEQFKQVIMSQQRDQADDVEQNRVPMRAQKAVRDYFQSLQDEAK